MGRIKGPLEKGPVSVDTLSVWKFFKVLTSRQILWISIGDILIDEDHFSFFLCSLKYQEDGLCKRLMILELKKAENDVSAFTSG